MLKQVKYFQAVARLGSFTEAAFECFISQSAVSQQVLALEQELGVKLVNRDKRRISLTPAGRHFYERSLAITADFEKLCRETAKIAAGGAAQLHIGYLKCCGGREFQLALAAFSEKFPDAALHVTAGNHEELYDLLRFGGVDLALSDQRRAFSDEYVNIELVSADCFVEVPRRSPLAAEASVDIAALKETPCILVASQAQQENERAYYRDVVGFRGDFIFAESLEATRMLAAGGKGVVPVDYTDSSKETGGPLCRVPLLRGGSPIRRTFCVFMRKDSANAYAEEFASMIKAEFAKRA